MILVIAEKPSVAQTIAAVLGAKEKKDGFLTGSGYIVSWCVGHLVGLSEAAAYGEQYKKWSYDSLPIFPQEWKYTVASDKEKQFKTLKELMHRADVSEVVNACDAGREGELIFRFVYEVAGCRKPTRRLWISSMEEAALKEGFSHLKNGEAYDALFASALCRAKADWLIGINATRLFSVLYNHTLNVGRVQTPTLKMLVDRDAAITTFKKEKYYHVRLSLSGAEAASEKLSDRSEADSNHFEYEFVIPETEYFIHIDVNAYTRVLNNLFQNIIIHSAGDKMALHICEDIQQAKIIISDNGKGIAPDKLPHIFERMYQCDQSRSAKGNGLGLAIAKELISVHKGTITAENSSDKGTVFTILLPKAL